jgi:hypothetical protein
MPVGAVRISNDQPFVRDLEPGLSYHASYFDPKTGDIYDLGTIKGDAQGSYQVPKPRILQDWVLILEAD